MAGLPGWTFAPTFENAELARRGGSPVGTNQDAIQVLNFQLPKEVGAASANAISPLVGSERRGVNLGSAVLDSVLKTILGADAASALLSGSPAAAAPGRPGRDRGSDFLSGLGGDDHTTSRPQGGGGSSSPQGGLQAPPFGQEVPTLPGPDAPVVRPGVRGPTDPEEPTPLPGTETDTTEGWLGHERDINGRGLASPWDAPGRSPRMAEKYGYDMGY